MKLAPPSVAIGRAERRCRAASTAARRRRRLRACRSAPSRGWSPCRRRTGAARRRSWLQPVGRRKRRHRAVVDGGEDGVDVGRRRGVAVERGRAAAAGGVARHAVLLEHRQRVGVVGRAAGRRHAAAATAPPPPPLPPLPAAGSPGPAARAASAGSGAEAAAAPEEHREAHGFEHDAAKSTPRAGDARFLTSSPGFATGAPARGDAPPLVSARDRLAVPSSAAKPRPRAAGGGPAIAADGRMTKSILATSRALVILATLSATAGCEPGERARGAAALRRRQAALRGAALSRGARGVRGRLRRLRGGRASSSTWATVIVSSASSTRRVRDYERYLAYDARSESARAVREVVAELRRRTPPPAASSARARAAGAARARDGDGDGDDAATSGCAGRRDGPGAAAAIAAAGAGADRHAAATGGATDAAARSPTPAWR